MASGPRLPGRRAWSAVVVATAVTSVAGCVSMQDSGPVVAVTAGPTNAGQNLDYIGSFPAGPQRGWPPDQVVEDFLLASANPNDSAVAKAYLTPHAAANWNPWGTVTVLDSFKFPTVTVTGQTAHVQVVGPVHATLNSSGQYTTAQAASESGGCDKPGDNCDNFSLVESGGVWRITNPPRFLLLPAQDFNTVYKPQNLYWFTPDNEKLVPDTVYVQLSAAPQDVLTELVKWLIQDPHDWLSNATATRLPKDTTVIGKVGVSGTAGNIATVNLGGAITTAKPDTLERVEAELAYTLDGLPGGGQSTIDSVQLEINGVNVGGLLKRSGFGQYEEYPQGSAASFTYVDGRTNAATTSCGFVQHATVGPLEPVFQRGGIAQLVTCASQAASPAPQQSASTAPGKKHVQGRAAQASTLSMVAVSPDGKYIAEITSAGPGKDTVSIGSAAGAWHPQEPVKDAPVTSISWDRADQLWVVGANSVQVIPQGGGAPLTVNGFDGTVAALSIAPDGVRVAAIVEPDGPGGPTQLELAAVNGTGSVSLQAGKQTAQESMGGATAPLGPGIANPVALTWYDATHLMVVDQQGTSLELMPVDGGAATPEGQWPDLSTAGPIRAITADTGANVIVVATAKGDLEAEADLQESSWEVVTSGSAPVYGG
jgi:Lipoprotein LpqB beta-propeller domain/Sporulation and spore germination